MYSSSISSPIVNQGHGGYLVCEVPQPPGSKDFSTMELYPEDYWYEYNVDGFGRIHFNEWDVFWFQGTLEGWLV